MKQTAIQQAIVMVRNRIDSQIDTMMGKHTAHHLQQVERCLYDLLEAEKEQIKDAFETGDFENTKFYTAQQYYNETYGKNA